MKLAFCLWSCLSFAVRKPTQVFVSRQIYLITPHEAVREEASQNVCLMYRTLRTKGIQTQLKGHPWVSVPRSWLHITHVSSVPLPSRVLEDSQERRYSSWFVLVKTLPVLLLLPDWDNLFHSLSAFFLLRVNWEKLAWMVWMVKR